VGKSTGGIALDVLKVFAAVLLVSLLLFLWARFVRRPSRRRAEHYKYPEPAAAGSTEATEETEVEHHAHHRRRYRKRKHEHRGRNPTLAEIGGLPPVRDADPTDRT
jgi:hypothetical protein